MGSKNGCVVGWYASKHKNIGDEAFKPAFQKIWPDFEFTFVNHVPKNINDFDFIWFGGGSFLDQHLPNPHKLDIKIPVGFIGVGAGHVHQDYLPLLKRAKAVVVRDKESQKALPGSLYMPDLVFSLDDFPIPEKSGKITILLSDFITPHSDSRSWQYAAYEWFMLEFSSVCDELVKRGHYLEFVPMCTGEVDDRRVAGALISRMSNRSCVTWNLDILGLDEFRNKINSSDLVITQRLHGMIFSVLSEVPYLNISFHDKMVNLNKDIGWQGYIDYYGFNKKIFLNLLEEKTSLEKLKDYKNKSKELIKCTSATVKGLFSQ